jgi:hypothetical protein
MDTSSLASATIEAVHTFACEPVHPSWEDENTTPIATAMAALELSSGHMLLVAPCEVALDSGRYPSLGLEVTDCDATSLQWEAPSGKTYVMQPLTAATMVLPFVVQSVAHSDPLKEGAVSEILLCSRDGASLIFRHIMPPMTLGISVASPDQAPNKSSKPTLLRGAA